MTKEDFVDDDENCCKRVQTEGLRTKCWSSQEEDDLASFVKEFTATFFHQMVLKRCETSLERSANKS